MKFMVKFALKFAKLKFGYICFLFLVLLQLSACIELRDKNKSATPPTPVASQTPSEKTSPDPSTNTKVSEAPKVEAPKFPDQVIDDVMYVYDGKILNERDLAQAQKENAYFNKSVGHDFEFKFNKLVFTERGILYSLGNNLRLHVQRLETQSGTLTTYPEGQTASINQVGRAGGHIFLDVVEGEGFINIIMRGENGGQGLNGAPPDISMKGATGKDGKDGDPYDSPDGCRHSASPGEVGEKGKIGHRGLQGAQGGDSGTLEVRIKIEDGLTYAIQKRPGHGGVGGPGGRGGEGGENGRNGTGSTNCMMGINFSKKPPRGPEGDPGPQGPSGPDGAAQTACINKGNSVNCN